MSHYRCPTLCHTNNFSDQKSENCVPAVGLHNAIIAAGRTFFGAALTIRNPVDATERAIVDNHADFGSITPENAMKWESTEPARGVFTFDGADAVKDYAVKEQKQVHCHTLVWHSQLPTWVSEGGFDNATLIQIMYDHIKAVAGRYTDVCTRWDVVNEGTSNFLPHKNQYSTMTDEILSSTQRRWHFPLFRLLRHHRPRLHPTRLQIRR